MRRLVRPGEAALVMARPGCGIGEWGSGVLGGEALEQCRVGAKLLAASMKLLFAAKDDLSSIVEGTNDSADLNILLAVACEISYVFAIGVEAHDGESAFIIGSFRAAEIEKASAIG